MGRPLKKSPPISVRVPIELWPLLQGLAEQDGQSVHAWVQGALERSLTKRLPKDP